MTSHHSRSLRLIAGGLDFSCQMGATRLGIMPLEAPAPHVDAVVIEQDTHGLLALDHEVAEPGGQMTQLTDELKEFEPYEVGGVVVKRAQPLQLLAIVHNLDLTPSWRETWIVSALDATFDIARARRLKRLGMSALGTVHGHLPLERFIELLVESVASRSDGPDQIWVGIKRSQCHRAVEQLKHQCTHHQSL